MTAPTLPDDEQADLRHAFDTGSGWAGLIAAGGLTLDTEGEQ